MSRETFLGGLILEQTVRLIGSVAHEWRVFTLAESSNNRVLLLFTMRSWSCTRILASVWRCIFRSCTVQFLPAIMRRDSPACGWPALFTNMHFSILEHLNFWQNIQGYICVLTILQCLLNPKLKCNWVHVICKSRREQNWSLTENIWKDRYLFIYLSFPSIQVSSSSSNCNSR